MVHLARAKHKSAFRLVTTHRMIVKYVMNDVLMFRAYNCHSCRHAHARSIHAIMIKDGILEDIFIFLFDVRHVFSFFFLFSAVTSLVAIRASGGAVETPKASISSIDTLDVFTHCQPVSRHLTLLARIRDKYIYTFPRPYKFILFSHIICVLSFNFCLSSFSFQCMIIHIYVFSW